jgi:hypothetical protein
MNNQETLTHLKTLIKNCEARIVDYKKLLESIHRDPEFKKVPATELEDYKTLIRDLKNSETAWKKTLETDYDKELNYPKP